MSDTLTGKKIGKCLIKEKLGSGGMARVYRANPPQLDRFVAIKVLRSDLVDDELFLTRFRREAQSVAALRHPNIIQVLNFDGAAAVSFMVVEPLEGATLHTRLHDSRVRAEPMPWGEIVRILLDVLDGLSYAHQEGMIHRDIKPANILLTRRGQAATGRFQFRARRRGAMNQAATGASKKLATMTTGRRYLACSLRAGTESTVTAPMPKRTALVIMDTSAVMKRSVFMAVSLDCRRTNADGRGGVPADALRSVAANASPVAEPRRAKTCRNRFSS